MHDDRDDEEPIERVAGEDGADHWGQLSFDITKVYRDQSPTREPPCHTDGGDWTFLNCRAGRKRSVCFTVGVLGGGEREAPRVWGKAWLAVTDRESGERLLRLFADAFAEEVPLPRSPQRPLEPLLVGTANLNDLRQVIQEGESEPPQDGWVATKWFLEQGRYSAEVYFNYNLRLWKGEFSEKDPDYREDLVGILAITLRDGPRPTRTPETDPNLTTDGPRIRDTHLILDRRSDHYLFTPGGKYLVYQDGPTLYALAPAGPGEPVELARFEHPLWEVVPADDIPNLLVLEDVPKKPRQMSSEDPVRVWWVDGGMKEPRLLLGPERWVGLGEIPVSPDRRFVALTKGKDRTDQRLRYTVVCLLDLRAGTAKMIDLPNRSLAPVGWSGQGGDLQVVLATNCWKTQEDERQEVYLADPSSGTLGPHPDPTPTIEGLRGVVSPDGKYLAEVEDEERLALTDLATKERRTFTFHEDDLSFAHAESVKWVSPRYLQFEGRRLALIDAEGLKMSFPAPADEQGVRSSGYRFSSDLAWVAFERETPDGVELHLGRVVRPRERG